MSEPRWTPEAVEALARAYVARMHVVDGAPRARYRHSDEPSEVRELWRTAQVALGLEDNWSVISIPAAARRRIDALFAERNEPIVTSPEWVGDDE